MAAVLGRSPLRAPAAQHLPRLGPRGRAAAAADGTAGASDHRPHPRARGGRRLLAAAPRDRVRLGQSAPSSAVWKLFSQGPGAAWPGGGTGPAQAWEAPRGWAGTWTTLECAGGSLGIRGRAWTRGPRWSRKYYSGQENTTLFAFSPHQGKDKDPGPLRLSNQCSMFFAPKIKISTSLSFFKGSELRVSGSGFEPGFEC